MEKEFKYEDENLDNDIEEKIEEKTEKKVARNSEFIGDTISLYLKNLPDLLTKEEEKALGYRILKGDVDAINTMVERNLKLVVSVAKHYRESGLPFEDVIQNGNLGLMKAARMYDVRKGYKFSTYAVHWIKQAICREADNTSRNIRVPSHFEVTIRKYKILKNKLISQYGEEPSKEEMARELEVSVEVIDRCEKLLDDTASLNVVVGDKKETELGALIASDVKTPEEEMLDIDLKEKTEELLNSGVLTSREIEVIKLRFGFDSKRFTLEEIGQLMGLTRERVRQIEGQALKKLKTSGKRYMIESYSKIGEDKGKYLVSNDSSSNINYGKMYQRNKKR